LHETELPTVAGRPADRQNEPGSPEMRSLRERIAEQYSARRSTSSSTALKPPPSSILSTGQRLSRY